MLGSARLVWTSLAAVDILGLGLSCYCLQMVLIVADGSYCDPDCNISVMCVIVADGTYGAIVCRWFSLLQMVLIDADGSSCCRWFLL